MQPIELLKALFFTICGVLWSIIKNNWSPFYTTIIKIAIISGIIYGICYFVPHGIEFLYSISYIGWFVLICVWRLLNVHYDDFEEQSPAQIEVEDAPEPPSYQQDPVDPAPKQENIGNIRRIQHESNSESSTRE